MKKFQFSLEMLLSHRIREERELQIELSLIERQIMDEKLSLSKIRDAIIKLHEEVRNNQIDVIGISEYAVYDNFIIKLKNDVLAKEEKIVEIENKLFLKREELIEAVKKRKIVDNLKEKKLLIHTEEHKKEEQNFMDEIGIYRFNRLNYII
jgi:flagellar FliJ protein